MYLILRFCSLSGPQLHGIHPLSIRLLLHGRFEGLVVDSAQSKVGRPFAQEQVEAG